MYVLIRRNWRAEELAAPLAQFVWCRNEDYDRDRMGTPVEAFTTYELAKQRHDELEREARQVLGSPFQFGAQDDVDPAELTSLPAVELQDRILNMGIMPPEVQTENLGGYEFHTIDWLGWWNDTVESLSEEQRHAIWDLLDRLHFYEIVEVKLEE